MMTLRRARERFHRHRLARQLAHVLVGRALRPRAPRLPGAARDQRRPGRGSRRLPAAPHRDWRSSPGYEQRRFDDRDGGLRLIASRDGRGGSVTVHLDAALYAARLAPGTRVEHVLGAGRHAWLHVARGGGLDLEATAPAEVLLFDLA